MVMSAPEVVAQAREMLEFRGQERQRLDTIRSYLRDDPDRRLWGLPDAAPREVHQLARASRVNMLKYVVNARTQGLYVDGFRAPRADEDAPPWDVWKRNRFNARQIGVHRGAISYGASFATVLPGDRAPVMRGVSPRHMTAVYPEDDDTWPLFALEQRRAGQWRLYDDEAVYVLSGDDSDARPLQLERWYRHNATFDGDPVTPVVRFRDTDDLDDRVTGVVEPLMHLQDQINITTFGLLVAQHYGAFRQRYIIGWVAASEQEKLQASASKLWTFEDDNVQPGEFGQTSMDPYLSSREATLRHLSTVSQTPVNELTGQLINVSAEGLAASREAHRRAISENQMVLGEAHQQMLELAGEMSGQQVDPNAEVTWQDTEGRSLAQVADALGKLVQNLGIPAQELWDRVPGASQTEVERWKAAAAEGDSMARLTSLLERQESGSAPSRTAGAAA